jgi:uncharacterized protein YdeI (YjbR/CyaY-like superfamily)
MDHRDPQIDAYIAKSAEFARPILKHLRELMHQGCPDVEETVKWGHPAFVHKGLICIVAAFQEHASLHFWRHKLIVGDTGEDDGMGEFGRITSRQDLPPDKILLGYVRKAVALNEAGVKPASQPRRQPNRKGEVTVPDFFAAALRKNKPAQVNFDKFSYSHKKEYIEWLTGAKREETRQRRLETALSWIAKGKPQNWKYMK